MQLTHSIRKQTSRQKAEQWLPGDGINKWGRGKWITKGYETTFVVEEHIYYPDCGDGSMGLYMRHSSLNHTLWICAVYYMSSHLNKALTKPNQT